MAKINVLPKEIYQLIAAGEVVERPSSVVKEMIENSIDAGATSVTVEIKNGGSTYIRITDNGCGIERDQIKKVFVPHATSKICEKEDLNAILTLGFRGEAMSSIAAVSKIELLTKAKGEDFGTRYELAGGEEIAFDEAGCPEGTTIVVRDIFYNTPARMKFLKKDVTEGNSVAAVVDRMALSHPEISFRFIRDGKQTLVTSGNGKLLSAIYSVFGKEVSDSLTAVDYTYENMRVTGYASKPIASRKSRAMQFFFINKRLVKSATAMAALEQAYKNSIMVGRFPMCVLNIQINPNLVDVNVHPAKIEVRFANEKPVFDLIYYGVKTAVQNDRTVKQAEFNIKSDIPPEFLEKNIKQNQNRNKDDFFVKKNTTPVQQVFRTMPVGEYLKVSQSPFTLKDDRSENDADNQNEQSIHQTQDGKSEYNTDEKPLSQSEQWRANFQKSAQNTNQAKFVYNASPQSDSAYSQGAQSVTADEKKPSPSDNFKLVGEAFKTYLIVEIDNELYFIDKHAAHERMNYEQLKSQETVETQMLLTPVVVALLPEEQSCILSNAQLLAECGFDVEQFGEREVIVRAVPSLVAQNSVSDLILEIAQKLLEHKTDITPDKIDWIYHSASCRGAVKAGDSTSPQEQELFVKKLLSMEEIRFCPHGRPVFIKISKYDIEKQFGRV